MKILVTGSKGFIAQNLIERLKENNNYTIFSYDIDSSLEDLDKFTKECDFVFHLAGVNRPKDEKEFMEGNYVFTSVLLNNLKKHNNKSPIMISSSTKVAINNPYGISKKAAEDLMFDYEKETGNKIYIFRLDNVFGKWAKPNYNSAVATFSYNIARDLPIVINDSNQDIQLVYIDDVVNALIGLLDKNDWKSQKFRQITPVYRVKLGYIVDLLYSFKHSRQNLSIPKLDDDFQKKLYSNYVSYLPKEKLIYDLKMTIDNRGSFTEFLRTNDCGQLSINVIKPGVTKGNHWHHSKIEKFLVVCGKGIIRFRKVLTDETIEYQVNSDKLQVLDIPPGYTHNIENIGEIDMVVIIWSNEPFDKNNPDTIYEEV